MSGTATTATNPMIIGGLSATGNVAFNATTGDESCLHTPLTLTDLPPPCVLTAGMLDDLEHNAHILPPKPPKAMCKDLVTQKALPPTMGTWRHCQWEG